jgi:hypothetical protein
MASRMSTGTRVETHGTAEGGGIDGAGMVGKRGPSGDVAGVSETGGVR